MRHENGTLAAPPTEDGLAEALEDYLEAAEAGTAPPREEFLARHPELAEQLDGCLAALRFIDRAAVGPRAVAASIGEVLPPEPASGTLGDFRLLREVGRGGMGVVYEAEQVSLGRRVALKVLPFAATMDPRQLQRFHTEARAAAALDHPHIVHVHAVGCERGVHYYAMQYIEGQTLAALIAQLRRAGGPPVPIAEKPTTPHVPGQPAPPAAETAPRAGVSTERTRLDRAYFRQVAGLGIQAAEALDQAHQLGIVHRDVKPANLLVDGRGGLWVTDFGLAHIQSDIRLTMTGDLVGTLRYMSPEQALAKRVVMDHRTDVYSLGATLYELLTLEPVFGGSDRQELLRQIAFEEPRAPRRVNKAIPAELETIVLKALEKNPADRYATAQALADDLRRHVEDKPIQARRPGVAQRLRKWNRRHRGAVATALAVVALVVVGLLGGLTWHNRQLGEAAEREHDLAAQAREAEARALEQAGRAEALNKFLLEDLLGQAAPEENARQRKVTVEDVLDKAAAKVEKSFPGRPDLEATVRLAIGGTYQQLGLYERGQPQLARAMALRKEQLGPDHPDTLNAVNNLVVLLLRHGKKAEAEPLLRQNLEARRRVLGPDHLDTLNAGNNLAGLLHEQGKLAEAEPLFRQNLEACGRVLGPDHPDTLNAVHNLAALLQERGKLAEAEPLLRQNLGATRRVQGPDHPHTLNAVNNLAMLLLRHGKQAEAEPLFRQNLEARGRVLGPDHPDTLISVNNLALLLQERGQLAEAEPLFRQNLEARRRVLGPDHPHTLTTVNNLAMLLRDQGKQAEAEPLLRQNLEAKRRVQGPDHPDTLISVNNLALLLQERGQLAEAELLLRQNLEARRRVLGPDHPGTLSTMNNMVSLLQERGQLAEAEPLLRQNLEATRRVLGADHPITLIALKNLAALLGERGQLGEAERLARDVLTRGRKALPAQHPLLTGSLTLLGDLLTTTGRATEAEPLLREAVQRQRNRLPPGHRDTAKAGSLLGACLAARKQYGEAEPLLLTGYRDLEKAPGTSPTERARAGARLVQLYEAWGKQEQADAWRKKLPAVNTPLRKPDAAKAGDPPGGQVRAPR